MDADEILKRISDNIDKVNNYGINKISIFGSFLRCETDIESDRKSNRRKS